MFKAVAVDIDGTFLTDHRDYDRPLFAKVLHEMQRQQIRFIVASGDQYAFLKGLFPDHANELGFVAENGVLVVDRQGEEIASGRLPSSVVTDVFAFLRQQPATYFTLCARHSAYIMDDVPAGQKRMFQHYYARLQTITALADIPEDVFKFALTLPAQQTAAFIQQFNTQFAGRIQPTVSGYGAIDLIIPHMNKGNGLRKLLDRWQLSSADLLAFGDNENDLPMFELAGESYAMANAPHHVQEAATHVAPSNNQQGVLLTLAKRLKI
ncbi:Cof-type HAD-IIB family hydrolase [uncultured Limosilactobacillus sp.]|uniref:Cof-type HAD-IIB family hydrolase n=1 Tax=uncultured Limosilactobacillus sp. TaxID=2837629 RepID=UPI0025D509A4|nr:Cof-type HAD-IIB family hydrolase [uncultured Limosilactobacillus sp.]